MKNILAICLSFVVYSSAMAEDLDVLSLLKRDLGDSIESHSEQEIWYCPTNTCDIYKISNPHPDFPAYVYLHLYHDSNYKYVITGYNEVKTFHEILIEEPRIRAKMAKYCPKNPKDPICILKNLKKSLSIILCSGRYDEGYFCYGCKPGENICKKY